MRILVLNCYSRNALAITNALPEDVDIYGAADSRKTGKLLNPNCFFRSPRIKSIDRYTNPRKDISGFIDDLCRILNSRKIDAVIPAGTETTNRLSEYKSIIEQRTLAKTIVEDYDKLSILTDKWQCMNFCRECGVPVPATELLDGSEERMLAIERFNYPVVIKPRLLAASSGVMFFRDFETLMNHYEQNRAKFGGGSETVFVVQEVIRGHLHDVALCANDGSVTGIMTQQRLVTACDFGGGGFINRTTHEEEIMRYARKIIAKIGWNGVALFDFIKDAQGRYYLLECNPKFWGTTALAIEAGFNVVDQAISVFTGKPVTCSADVYEINVVYKWIFPECISLFCSKPRTLGTIVSRILRYLKRYNNSRVVTNLQLKNVRHSIGMFLN